MPHYLSPTFSTSGSEPGRHPEPEVVSKAIWRTLRAANKLRIEEEADQCTSHGQIGALLRREGLYSSQLGTWRRKWEAGGLQAMAPKKRGRKIG